MPPKAEDYITATLGVVLPNYAGNTPKRGMRAQIGPNAILTDGEESNDQAYCDKSHDIQTLPLTG